MKHNKQPIGTINITKELFTESMDAIFKQHEHDAKCSDAFNIILPNYCVVGYDNTIVCNNILNILKIAFRDNHKDSWIDYFIYDLDFGRNYKDGSVKEKDGTSIPLATIDDLWNFLYNVK